MNIYFNTILSSILLTGSLFAMESQSIIYRQATMNDAQQLCTIISEEGIKDRDKIVVLPEAFRLAALQSAIEKGRLYIATEDDKIVGFKKFFLITDSEERKDIMENEIRCYGKQSKLVASHLFSNGVPMGEASAITLPIENSVAIYDGGDLTITSYRGLGINSQLRRYAFKDIADKVKKEIDSKDASALLLLYGLTKINAGEVVNGVQGVDRTPSIAKAFSNFVSEHTPMQHQRYEAFMPTFDLKSTECRPLPDAHSVPGYGNVLYALLKE